MNREFLLLSLSREKTTKKNSLSRTESRTLNYHHVSIGDFQATIFPYHIYFIGTQKLFSFCKIWRLDSKKTIGKCTP